MNAFFTAQIEKWYGQHKRSLPWRDTKDPYLVWISEIILQQTRVAQGLDYYFRFIHRFPDVQTLAQAGEDEVLLYWQGLGYYSRARNLHAASKMIVAAGGFPTKYEEVLKLKGVGDYTAAAICSFAYGLPYAVVDGNVYRVLSRYFGVENPIDSVEGKKLFRLLAQDLLDSTHPALYNQAIMDFGALQCTPSGVDCTVCPLAEGCVAFRKDAVGKYPVKSRKTKVTHRFFTYIYIRAGNKVLLHKREATDVWRNLYEVPLIEFPSAPSFQELTLCAEWQRLVHFFDANDMPYTVREIKKEVKHVLSHQVIHADFYAIESDTDTAENTLDDCSFVPREALHQYAKSRLIEMLFEEI